MFLPHLPARATQRQSVSRSLARVDSQRAVVVQCGKRGAPGLLFPNHRQAAASASAAGGLLCGKSSSGSAKSLFLHTCATGGLCVCVCVVVGGDGFSGSFHRLPTLVSQRLGLIVVIYRKCKCGSFSEEACVVRLVVVVGGRRERVPVTLTKH